MRYLLTIILAGLATLVVHAQKFVTEKTSVVFFSDAAIEDITAKNAKTAGLFNPATGDIAFSVPIKEFQFEKSLMQEHFNEKYMESEKYPKATFQGVVTGFDAKATGSQTAKANGKLTIHGVTKEVEIPGTIAKEGDTWLLKTKFIVKLVDYKIEIPQLLWQNIAEQVEVTADFIFKAQ